MKKLVFGFLAVGLVAGCSHSKMTSGEAQEQLQEKWSAKVGSATKSDLMEQFGNAEWCRADAIGEETCRFYKKKGTVWLGDDKRDKKSYESYDEVVAVFDAKGILKSYKANAQR